MQIWYGKNDSIFTSPFKVTIFTLIGQERKEKTSDTLIVLAVTKRT